VPPNDISVSIETQETIVTSITPSDAITATVLDALRGATGPTGPIGPTGATGAIGSTGPAGGGVSFEWDQNSASAQWNINHNLECHPSVTIVDSSGREVWGDVQYIDQNNVQLNFQSAFGGKAYLN
jgi:hypothetical protein